MFVSPPTRIVLRLALVLAAVVCAAPLQAQQSDAFVDDGARELLRRARERRTTVDRRIEQYQTTARERLTARIGAELGDASRLSFGIDKLFFRRQSVTRIDWERDGPIRLEVLAARNDIPMASSQPQVRIPSGRLDHHRLAYDPVDPDALLLFDSTVVRHPLAHGSETHYRFASGDTTTIQLPDGRAIRLHELRIIPRRRDPQLINGSFWLDAQTHALVQAYFKLARAYDSALDDIDTIASLAMFINFTQDDGDPPSTGERWAGVLPPIRAELDFVALEYGLWESHWWLPRRVVWRGALQVGRVNMPIAYERTYEDYAVRGDTSGAVVARTDSTRLSCRPRVRFLSSLDATAAPDAERQRRVDAARARQEAYDTLIAQRRAAWGAPSTTPPDCPHDVIMAAAPDSVLLTSPELARTAGGDDLELISARELKEIIAQVQNIPDPPCCTLKPVFLWGPYGPGLLRYNRVEGLSIGARLRIDPTARLTVETEARIGHADLDPRGEVSLLRRGDRMQTRFAGYRRLASVTQSPGTHGTWSTIGAVLLARDDDAYYDARGAEVVIRPPALRTQWAQLRLYAEQQRAVERNTEFSVLHLIDSDRNFPDNFTADAADQLGAQLRLRARAGRNPAGAAIAAELSLSAETGDFTFLRPEALVRTRVPLLAGFLFGGEAAAGTVEGTDVSAQQSLWHIGGAQSLRGYPASHLVGERYWRGRAEVGRALGSVLRGAVFLDAAWVGPRTAFHTGGTLYSAGFALSQYDGLVKINVGRGLASGSKWRVQVQANSVL